ncbi:oxygen-insensitive NADPH nitroreductase [Paenibacillus sp. NEAU-GSW1]|uniref:oxygen-insensitive NADPH nitroreductase n=1 Tax=Paenibacillus sp. NEAU-GSW1 TaxID=2682486 RepID=UPI00139E8FB2|nr:oxygen-insensitive NADPH nitroreductase [Paenibacillus sp. NEAU-GSW1]
MNETIQLLLNHRSIRKYKETPVSEEQLDAILGAAQHASTSSNMQAYSVIGVTEPEIKNKLAELAGNQAYVAGCPLFLVWCADLYRYEKAQSLHMRDKQPSTVEHFIIATVDAALAAQNAAVAAESLGLGIVYIGGIRNNPQQVSELLGLPEHVYPVFGMCVGVPDQEPLTRPRLPRDAVYHANKYNTACQSEAITTYDETMSAYMSERTDGKAATSWSEAMAAKTGAQRLHMRPFLRDQGFMLE